MIDTIFVPRGAEAGAVRRALDRANSPIRVVEMGIGPHAARLAVESALAGPTMTNVLVTGLCGLLSPAFAVGDALVYGEIVEHHAASTSQRDSENASPPRVHAEDVRTVALDRDLALAVAAHLPNVQSGIRAVAVDGVVVHAREKIDLGRRYRAQAVDMESLTVARGLRDAGVSVAVVRVGSDGVSGDLPDLHMALDGSGGLDGFALALAMLRRPIAGIRLARNGTRALASLEGTIARVVAS